MERAEGDQVTKVEMRRAAEAEKRWLLMAFRADVDAYLIDRWHGYDAMVVPVDRGTVGAVPACRCYRCGVLLIAETMRIDNPTPVVIRPACEGCVSDAG